MSQTLETCRVKFNDAFDYRPGKNAYFVNLVGVSVAGRRLRGITKETFERRNNNGDAGTVINPGVSTMMMLQAAYDILEHAHRVCLNGSTTTVRRYLPTVTLHFDDPGVDLQLSPQQLFVGPSEVTCLAVVPGSTTVIGAMQQTNMRFTYDFNQGAIFFAPENYTLDTTP